MPRAYGRHARLLWTPASGSEDFRRDGSVLLDVLAVEDDWSLQVQNVTELGSSDQEFASFGRQGRFLIRVDTRPDTVPQVPTHVPVTLRIYDSKHYARYREGSCILSRARWAAQAARPGEPQSQWYSGQWTGELTQTTEAAPAFASATWDPVTAGLAITFSRDIARGSAALAAGIRFINASGARYTVGVEPTIAGAVATVPLGGGFNFSLEAGPFTPVSTIDIVAGFFKSADFPSDPDMVQALINDAALT